MAGRLSLLLLLLHTGIAEQIASDLLPLLLRSTDEPTTAVAALLATEAGVLALHTQTERQSGNKPLHVAALRGWGQVTRLLAEAGANVEHTNAQHATPLVAAAQVPGPGQLGVVSALLDWGADVNARPARGAGHSALHICARDGNDAICATLLSAARVDPNIQTSRELQRTFLQSLSSNNLGEPAVVLQKVRHHCILPRGMVMLRLVVSSCSRGRAPP